MLKEVEVEYIIGIFYLLYPGNPDIMGPKKKSKLACSTSNAWTMKITRALETPEDAQARLAVQQARQTAARATETPVQRQTRQATNQARMAAERATETPVQR